MGISTGVVMEAEVAGLAELKIKGKEVHMLREWLSFRRFITPVVIQGVFWLGVVAFFILGLVSKSGWQFFLIFFGGSFAWRLFCELDILFFRIYDELKLERGSKG